MKKKTKTSRIYNTEKEDKKSETSFKQISHHLYQNVWEKKPEPTKKHRKTCIDLCFHTQKLWMNGNIWWVNQWMVFFFWQS